MLQGSGGTLLPLILNHAKTYGIFYLALWILLQCFYNIFFHPLAKYPGPFWAKLTVLWRSRVSLSGDSHLVYYEAHRKYGPVFRDGPNSLSFNDHRAMKAIYGHGKDSFPRTKDFPPAGLNTEQLPVFFTIDSKTHGAARRKVGSAYTMNSILQMEDQVDSMLSLLETKLDELSTSGLPFDICPWMMYFTTDIISDLAFGEAFGSLKAGGDHTGIVESMQDGWLATVIMGLFPQTTELLCTGPLSKYFAPPDSSGVGLAIKMARKIVTDRYKKPTQKKDLLNAMISSKDPNGTPIHPDQVRGEVMAALTAGGDTTAMAILGTTGYLLQNPQCLQKLRAELDEATREGKISNDIPAFAPLAQLSYLTAVVNETLRLSPSVGISFRRKVPDGGSEVIPGEWVPGGVIVGVNNWVMGRNEAFYGSDALQFRPERWLEDPEKAKRMREHEFAFGQGSRICIGRNLALVEVYKTVTELTRKYEIGLADPNHLWKENSKLFLYRTDMMITLKRRQVD